MSDDMTCRIHQLFTEVAQHGMSRRQMIQRAAVLGISGSALTVAFLQKAQEAIAQGAENPLGVDPAAPLDVVIFKGGYSDEYAINVNDNIWPNLYPDSKITYIGTQRLQEQFQARVVDGNPPDVMDNSGAGNFSTTSLYNDGNLADVTDLMAAPAYGQDGVTFADSLAPNTQLNGMYDGVQYVLKYVYSVNAVWHNQALFDEKGWTYPQTWDDMLALCQTIKDEGEYAPWTYAGLYPQYMRAVFDQLVFKSGGWEAQLKLDNIEADAWTQPVVKQAMDAVAALYTNGYILEGTEGLSHTESQSFWVQGEAVFLPCGSWLENESKDDFAAVPDFKLVVNPVPSLTAEDALPFAATQVTAGEDFIVFARGKNVQGGKEWLRLLFSKEGAKFFSEATKSLTVVNGSSEGLDLGSAFASVQEVIAAAGNDVFVPRWPGYYVDLKELSEVSFNELLTGAKTSDQVIAALQAECDRVRADASIPKFVVEQPGTPGSPGSATPAASPEASPAA